MIAFCNSRGYGLPCLANKSVAGEPTLDSMPRRLNIKDRQRLSGSSSKTTTSPPEAGVFRKEGEFWTIAYRNKIVHVRDSKGLGYIAQLLRSPGTEFHALDLVGGAIRAERTAGAGVSSDEADDSSPGEEGLERGSYHVGNLGSSGEMLDPQAIAAYKEQITELRDELERAKRLDDVERATKAEDDIDALERELRRAVGLGGRRRVANSDSERARLSVTQAIKGAITKIGENHPTLGTTLAHDLKTGTYCSYNPLGVSSIEWEFGVSPPYYSTVGSGTSADTRETDQESLSLETSPQDLAERLHLSLSQRTEFVGREAERAQISAMLQRVLNGSGGVVLLSGGAGVGKTRLSVEGAKEASERGALVLAGCCYATEEPHPYIPFVEMVEMALSRSRSKETFRRALGENAAELAQIVPRLRQLFPDIPPSLELPPLQARRYLFYSLFDFVARFARSRPVLLLIEDLHWADESTLSLFLHFARQIREVPIVIVATYRDVESEMSPSFLNFLEELARSGIGSARLIGLSRDRVADLLQALSGSKPPQEFADTIHHYTSGNPFFVEELFRHLIEEGKVFDDSGRFRHDFKLDELDVPENVRLVVKRRLDRLPEEVRPVLIRAALIGRRFSFKLLESFEYFNEDTLLNAIDEGLRAGLIVSSSRGPEAPFSFSHELVRQSLLTEISAPRRQRLHALVARAIERAHGAHLEDHAAEIANHLTQAGKTGDATRLAYYLGIAGKRALEAAAYEDALRHLTEAVSRHDSSDRANHAELLADLATAERSLGRWEDALGHWRESLALYTALGDRSAASSVYIAIVEALNWAGRYFEAAEFAFRGLAHLEKNVTSDRARLLGALGAMNTAAGAYQPARDALVEAVQMAEQLGDAKSLGLVLSYRSFHNFVFLRPSQAIADGLRSAEILRAGGALWSLAQLLGFLATAVYESGRLAEATRILDELEPLAKKLGHRAAQMVCNRIRAWAEFARECNLVKLGTWFQRDLEITQTANLPWIATSFSQLALLEFWRGNWAVALTKAEEACAAEFPNAFDGFGVGMLLRHSAYRGDRARTLALFAQTKDKLPRFGMPSPVGAWGLLMLAIEALVVIGEGGLAAELYPLALQGVDTCVVCLEIVSRFPQTVAGLAAAAGEQWDEAEAHFQIAMRQSVEFPYRLEQTEIRRFYGQMLIERNNTGDRDKARTMLGEAIEGYSKIGMPRHTDITRTLLKLAGA
jgi:tetratricopeptide (TPR) repeat protein